MQRFVPRRDLPWWQRILIVVIAIFVAWAVRKGAAPLMVDQSPYALFFVAVLITGLSCGWELSVVTALVGGVVANVEFVPPYGQLSLNGTHGWGFALYILTAMLIVWLTQSVANALRRETLLAEHLGTLSEEYRHRVKNLLAIAQSLVSQTARHTEFTAEFEDKIVGRFHALSRAQDLLSSNNKTIALRRLLDDILSPFDGEARIATSPESPDVAISPDAAVSLALILNELATNATKYGALSVRAGEVRVQWSVQGPLLIIEWRERGGPVVAAPAKRGFGSRLFEQAISHNSGKAEITFNPDGIVCEIKIGVG